MANKKISELSSRTPALSDLMIVGDPSSGYSYKCTVTALATIIETDIADGYVTIGTTQTISGAKTFSNNLTLTSVANATTTQSKFLTLNGSNVVNYRTGAEVLSDIGGQASLSGTGLVKSTSGTISYITDNSSNWNTAYNDSIVSAAVSGTTTKTLTLTQQDGGTLTASWTDINTDAVTSVFGRTGAVVATEGDYTLTQLGDVTITTPSTGQVLKYNGTIWVNDTDANTGTVTSVALSTGTTGTDISVSGSPITSSGTITLNIPTASATNRGALSSTDWSTFNGKQNAITLTTTGSSGSATFVSNTLNIPTYTLAGLGGISLTSLSASSPLSYNSGTGAFSISQSSGSTNGFLSSTDWNTFNNKQNALTLTTTGTSGAATLVGSTLNIPQYQAALTNPVTGTGTTNYIPKFTSSSAIGNSTIQDNTSSIVYTFSSNPVLNITDGTRSSFFGTATSAGAYVNASQVGDAFIRANNGIVFSGANGTGGELRLDAFGNLGLGTSSPSEKLDVYNNSASNVSIKVGNTSGALQLLQGNGAAYLYTATNQPLIFSNNNSEKMRLDASGNLGLGTSAPLAKLDITSGLDGTYNSNILINSNVATAKIAFNPSGGASTGIGSGNGTLLFYTNGANTERMRLDASGNLGLGVSPSAWDGNFKAIESPAGSIYDFQTTAKGFSQNAYFSSSGWLYKTTNTASLFVQINGEHRWYNAPSGTAGNAISFTQAMTLDASGRLGIGTTSPDGVVHATGSSTNKIIKLERTGSAAGSGFIYANQNDLFGVTDNSLYPFIVKQGAPTNSLVIQSSGNVGIGTTSPLVKLHVDGTGTQYIRVSSSDNATFQQIGAGVGGTFVEYKTLYRFVDTDAGERMRITSGGQVGIGTTTFNYNTAGRGQLALSGSTDAILEFQSGTTSRGYIYANATNFEIATPDARFINFITNNTERMRITSGGNVGIGTTSPVAPLSLPLNTSNSQISTGSIEIQSYAVNNSWVGDNVYFNGGAFVTRNAGYAHLIYFGTTDGIKFFTGNSSVGAGSSYNATEKMRLTSTGELLINTTSDAGDYKLQVNGNILSLGFVAVSGANDGLIVYQNGGSANLPTYTSNTDRAQINFKYAQNFPASNNYTRTLDIVSTGDGTGGGMTRFFTTTNNSTPIEALRLTTSQNAEFGGSIKTAAPSGGTAKPWKLGEAGVTLGGSNTSGVRVEIDGVVYYLVTGYLP